MVTSKTFQTLFLGFRWSTTTCNPMSNVSLSVWRESVWPPASYEAKATKESILKRRKRKMFLCVVWYIKLRLIVMPTIWNIEKGGERWRKQKVGRQASKAQRGKELEREKKAKETFFVRGTTWHFVAAVRKWEMLSSTRVNMSDVKNKKKIEQVHVKHFLHLTGNQEVSGSFTL